ncbi:TorF family putative porin [Qipengyuania sp. GH25]|uniref:TorF family putative porin n=1 Tax=Qipengyuania pacifica TaxID=2860199 RepID=A0ABS7JF15_9SPHN|nr:TorF family putative porin [Qipengyuania aerophila]MBX7488607.1 TorF family putative porin [Qipengyuania aerophila]
MICLAALAASLATATFAQDVQEETDQTVVDTVTVSGGTALVSSYRFRGIDLSDKKVAVQGWASITHQSGLYAGTWASSIDGFGELGGSNLELDIYAGYKVEVADEVTFDGGVIYYAYPDSTGGEYEFFEPYAKLGLAAGFAAVTLGVAYAPPQDAIGGKNNLYVSADAALPIEGTPFALDAHVGRSEGETTLTRGGGYTDWSLGASASWKGLTARVAYFDTDISDFSALAAGATPEIVDDAVVVSLTAAF